MTSTTFNKLPQAYPFASRPLANLNLANLDQELLQCVHA